MPPWVTAALYTLTSLLGVLVNKAVFSSFHFPYPVFILLAQLAVTTAVMSCMYGGMPRSRPTQFIPLLVVAALFISNVLTGLVALETASLPMFSVFRRLSALAVMLFEALVFGRRESRRVERAVALMTLGSVLAAVGEVRPDWRGYLMVMLNNLATAWYLVALKKVSSLSSMKQVDSLAMTYYTNALAVPLTAAAFWWWEWRPTADDDEEVLGFVAALHHQLHQHGGRFVVALLVSACSALAVNVTTLWCTASNSPLTTAIAGQTKNLLQTALGFVFWEYHFTALNAVGLILAAIGSAMFAHAKFTRAARSTR